MSFKRRLKKALRRILGDTSGIAWKDLDHKKVYGALVAVAAVIVLVVVLIISAVTGDHKEKNQPEQTADIVAEEQAVEEAAEEPVDENPLEVNAYAGINELIANYLTGNSTGDTALVESTVNVLTEEEKLKIEKKKEYIEAYNNIICYTKKGLEENSYVVFVSYEQKFSDLESAGPGIMPFYVCTDDNGSLYIYNEEASEELVNYVLELAADEEVAAIIADVDARYEKLKAEDEDFRKFVETLESLEKAETEAEEPEAPVEGEAVSELETPVKTTVTDGIRMRAERSTESGIRATLVSGTEVNVYANYSDGWSKIAYDGDTGYCKTEYLASTEGVPTVTESGEEQEAEGEGTASAPAESEVTAVNKEMKFSTAVRIRAERSADSEQIGSGYAGAKVKVIESYSDGWSKLSFEGKTGYCMTRYLQ